MIDFEKAIKNISNGKDYLYLTDHFIVRITFKNNEVKIRLQVKGTEMQYKYIWYNADIDEKELKEMLDNSMSYFALKFVRDLQKEILK